MSNLDRFNIVINLGNDAMRTPQHVAAALAEIAASLQTARPFNKWGPSSLSEPVRDVNGSTVGQWEVTSRARPLGVPPCATCRKVITTEDDFVEVKRLGPALGRCASCYEARAMVVVGMSNDKSRGWPVLTTAIVDNGHTTMGYALVSPLRTSSMYGRNVAAYIGNDGSHIWYARPDETKDEGLGVAYPKTGK